MVAGGLGSLKIVSPLQREHDFQKIVVFCWRLDLGGILGGFWLQNGVRKGVKNGFKNDKKKRVGKKRRFFHTQIAKNGNSPAKGFAPVVVSGSEGRGKGERSL